MNKLNKNISIKPKWDTTPDQVWNERFAALTDEDVSDDKSNSAESVGLWRHSKFIFSIAAAVLILFSATAFIYTKEFIGSKGIVRTISLPDGSSAQISAGSSISYHPLLWHFSHSVSLLGEAYFSGHHAEGFSVSTPQGEIEVLGTSFNARTYDNQLIVTCIQGKVKVKTKSNSVELTADMAASAYNGSLTSQHVSDSESAVAWTKGIFSFYDEPVVDVIREVERYYGIKVNSPQGIDSLRYTGQFNHDKSAQEALDIIGLPYGIKFEIVK